jgi:4,5-DOPA dioxygenase extradiol
MQRRHALALLGAGGLGVLGVGAFGRKEDPLMSESNAPAATELPVLFLAHGAPMLLDDAAWVKELGDWARALPKPKSILMVSAHWEDRPTSIGAETAVPLVYDFYGFPEKYYQLQYPSPGAPELASRVRSLLSEKNIPVTNASTRGLDHGAYVPLLCMYPDANVPVLQVSMPSLDPKELYAVGRALRPLAKEGVLVIGSGFLTHNMSTVFKRDTPEWAHEFDDWAKDVLARRDVDQLLDFIDKGPAARTALPTTEHFAPVIFAAGAADDGKKASFPITGFWPAAGSFTKRSVQFG